MSRNRPTNTAERLALRKAFIPTDARCVLEHTNGSAAYVYETAGAWYAIAFRGTAARREFHYRYRTAVQRDAAIWTFRESVNAQVERLTARKAAVKASAGHTLSVGDIVNTSWGYDQTNVDFFIVTRVSASSVWVRAIKQDAEAIGAMQARVWPAMPIEMVGPESRHLARGSSFSVNGHSASLSGGRDHYSSSYA